MANTGNLAQAADSFIKSFNEAQKNRREREELKLKKEALKLQKQQIEQSIKELDVYKNTDVSRAATPRRDYASVELDMSDLQREILGDTITIPEKPARVLSDLEKAEYYNPENKDFYMGRGERQYTTAPKPPSEKDKMALEIAQGRLGVSKETLGLNREKLEFEKTKEAGRNARAKAATLQGAKDKELDYLLAQVDNLRDLSDPNKITVAQQPGESKEQAMKRSLEDAEFAKQKARELGDKILERIGTKFLNNPEAYTQKVKEVNEYVNAGKEYYIDIFGLKLLEKPQKNQQSPAETPVPAAAPGNFTAPSSTTTTAAPATAPKSNKLPKEQMTTIDNDAYNWAMSNYNTDTKVAQAILKKLAEKYDIKLLF